MSDSAIKVQNVTKTFRIYNNPVDRLKEILFLGKRYFHHDFHALKNISFEIKKGEFIGIVGRNGAGKSTLLKILSRELTATEGVLEVNGTVSLLQLGAGFDKELTGRENARFSCQLQGLSAEQTELALKEIEKFADIGSFFEHPVKTYSSGMYSRLSFACAVNVNPDILIVDEVLSVGDMQFSQKCFRKMHEFKSAGKTIVFVSHDTDTLGVFCDRALWIKDGELFQQGDAKKIAESYKSFMLYGQIPTVKNELKEVSKVEPMGDSSPWIDLSSNPSFESGKANISHFSLTEVNSGKVNEYLVPDQTYRLGLKIKVLEDARKGYFGWMMYDKHGLIALHTNSQICGDNRPYKKGQEIEAYFKFRLPWINSGPYIFSVGFGNGEDLWCRVQDVYPVKVDYKGHKSQQCGYMLVTDEELDVAVK